MIVSKIDLATIFGVTTVTIDDWVRMGCEYVKKGGRGKQWEFNTAEVFKWRLSIAEQRNNKTDKNADYNDLIKEKISCEIERLNIQNGILRKDLLDAVIVKSNVISAFLMVKKNGLALPARAILRLEGCDDNEQMRAVLEDEVNIFLENSANSLENFDVIFDGAGDDE